jgi:hypothetical protein
VATWSPPTPRRLTLFSDEQAIEASSVPLSGGLEGDNRNPYTEVGAQLHNSIGGSQQEVTSFVQRQDPRRKGRAITNHLDRIVDLGPLSQTTNSWGIWLAREREIYKA